MDKRKIIFYSDERNDEFSTAKITPKKIDGGSEYYRAKPWQRLARLLAYRVIATPIAYFYSKGVFHHKIINKKCCSFCYPYGLFKPYIKSVVKKYYEVAFSVDCGGNDFEKDTYQITRIVPEELKKYLLNIRY